MSGFSECENCSRYVWNDELEEYECLAVFDEDEYGRFISGSVKACPYYCRDDEYKIVRKQN